MALTKQEKLFFDRVALVLHCEPTWTIEQGCRAVLDADIRILNTYSRLTDAKQSEMKKWFSDGVYRRLKTHNDIRTTLEME